MDTAQNIYYGFIFDIALFEQDATQAAFGLFLNIQGILELTAGDVSFFTKDFTYPFFPLPGLVLNCGLKA